MWDPLWETQSHRTSDFCTLGLALYFGLFHLVVADELSVATACFHQGLMVSALQHLAILQNQDVITELQILTDTREDSHVNKPTAALWPKVEPTQSKQQSHKHFMCVCRHSNSELLAALLIYDSEKIIGSIQMPPPVAWWQIKIVSISPPAAGV